VPSLSNPTTPQTMSNTALILRDPKTPEIHVLESDGPNPNFDPIINYSSFAAGQKVILRNHVTGTEWDELTIESVGKWVIARTRSGNERKFKLDGVASWSCNLSIRPTNDGEHPTAEAP